jgi:hypothetical protein
MDIVMELNGTKLQDVEDDMMQCYLLNCEPDSIQLQL